MKNAFLSANSLPLRPLRSIHLCSCPDPFVNAETWSGADQESVAILLVGRASLYLRERVIRVIRGSIFCGFVVKQNRFKFT